MKIKDMLSDSRPREKLLKFGVSNLSDSELLAIILQQGTKDENVLVFGLDLNILVVLYLIGV